MGQEWKERSSTRPDQVPKQTWAKIRLGNDDLKDIELSKTDETLVHPDYIAEVPGIEVQ